jgi:hypothetical protein
VVVWRVAKGDAETAETRVRRAVAAFMLMIAFGCVGYNLFRIVVSVWLREVKCSAVVS